MIIEENNNTNNPPVCIFENKALNPIKKPIMEVEMRVYCTSVEETINAKDIEKSLKKIYPKYSIVIIPNKYATEKGKKEVKECRKQYHLKNKELENLKRRRYYYEKKGDQEKVEFYNEKVNEILRKRDKK